jgi:hypothetical protein
MRRFIPTRISDEQYAKIMGKCSGLGCSVYDYLKMLVETDISDAEKARHVDEKKQAETELDERIRQQLEAAHSNAESKSVGSLSSKFDTRRRVYCLRQEPQPLPAGSTLSRGITRSQTGP